MIRPLKIVGMIVAMIVGIVLITLLASMLLTAAQPSWSEESNKSIYYALTYLVGLITTIVDGKWTQIWDALQILAVLTTICIIPIRFYKLLQSIASSVFQKSLLEGKWYAYHKTRMHGVLLIREEEWTINRNLQNELVIQTNDPKIPNLRYKGSVLEGKEHFTITLWSNKLFNEIVTMQFPNIIPTDNDMVTGLAMGLDFESNQQCLLRIMSRKRLSFEQAEKILQSETVTKDGILSISGSCERPIEFDQNGYQHIFSQKTHKEGVLQVG
jgi:hypothetical protein